MTFKIYYRRNLKMTSGKLAAQACHAAIGYGVPKDASVVVLSASDAKYYERVADHPHDAYRVVDAGYTELTAGTETCMGYMED